MRPHDWILETLGQLGLTQIPRIPPLDCRTNTGSPVVFTINPPQCQMDVLLGHGMGPKIGESMGLAD